MRAGCRFRPLSFVSRLVWHKTPEPLVKRLKPFRVWTLRIATRNDPEIKPPIMNRQNRIGHGVAFIQAPDPQRVIILKRKKKVSVAGALIDEDVTNLNTLPLLSVFLHNLGRVRRCRSWRQRPMDKQNETKNHQYGENREGLDDRKRLSHFRFLSSIRTQQAFFFVFLDYSELIVKSQ